MTFILMAWLLRIVADLFLIPRWVREHNAGAVGVALPSPAQVGTSPPMVVASAPAAPADAGEKEAARPPKDLQTILLEAAHDGDGKLTVTQGVMATGKTFEEVETCLRRMTTSGYVDVDRDLYGQCGAPTGLEGDFRWRDQPLGVRSSVSSQR